MHDPEPHDRLFLAPADELKMVMYRRHLEDAAVKDGSAEDLDDDGDRFDIEHEADEKERLSRRWPEC